MSEFNFPTSIEKQKAILMSLKNGNHLSVLDMQRVGRTTEGRRVVSRLRKQGYDIRSYRREGEQFKMYYLLNPTT